MKRISLIILITLCGILAVKGQNFWTESNGPFGGEVRDIIRHTSGALITVGYGGLFRSTDNGTNWTRITTGIVTGDIDFRDLDIDAAGKLYSITYSRLYTSIDQGLTWTNVSTTQFTDGKILKVAPNGNIYLATYDNILRSTNSGASFTTTGYSVANQITGLQINSSNVVYVARFGQAPLFSSNNGTSWGNIGSSGFPAINTGHNYKIVLDNATPNNLYALTNVGPYKISTSGSAWSSVKSNLAEVNYYGNLFTVGADLFLFNNDVSKMFVSTNGGTSWDTGQNYYLANTNILAFTRLSATEYFKVVSTFGVYKSTDSGAFWSPVNSGIKATNPRSILIGASQSRLMVPTNDKGYQVSFDDGLSWDLVSNGTSDRYIAGMLKLSDNSIVAYGDGIIRTTNEGNSWNVQVTGGYYNPMAANGTDLYTFTGNSLMRSTNLGVTWTTTPITGLGTTLDKILVDNAGNAYIRDYNLQRVMKIASGASTATQLSPSAIDFTLVGNTILILSNATTLEKSIDGGTIFNNITWNSSLGASKIWAYSEKDIFTMGNQNGRMAITNDGGTTWTNQTLLDAEAYLPALTWRVSGNDVFLYAAAQRSIVHKSTTGVIPPAAPTNLALKGKSFNGVTLLWDDNSNNEASYEIESSKSDNLNFALQTTISGGSSFQGKRVREIGTDINTLYYFRVRAVNSAGKSAYSNEVSTTTLDQCPTAVPNNRSWTGVATADPGSTPTGGPGPFVNNNIWIRNYTGAANFLIATDMWMGINGSSYEVYFDESCNSTYLSWDGLSLANGNGNWNSTTKTLTIKWQHDPNDVFFQGTTTYTLNTTDPIPTAPSLAVYTYSGTEVLLNWNNVGFETQYIIEKSTSSGGPYVQLPIISYPTTFYLEKNLTTGLTYYYRIKAKNATGTSGPSSEVSAQLQPVLFRPVENDIQLNFENQQGVSWGDLDGDGWEDIASPSFQNGQGQAVSPVFYKNLGATSPGQFERKDLAVFAGVDLSISRGINLFDFNNDGKLDMYITRSGSFSPDLLLINNNNDWTFTKIAVTGSENYETGFRSSVVLDYDKDGFADIFVGQDANLKGLLYRNINGTTLSQVTGTALDNIGLERNISAADTDNDGDIDILIQDYNNAGSGPAVTKLYKNNNDGTFTKASGTALFDTDFIRSSRTCSWGDIDNDGDLDLFIGTQSGGGTDRLYRNDGNNVFTFLSSNAVSQVSLSYGSSFGDLDNDGDVDLVVAASGSNTIFFNDGVGNFTKYPGAEMVNHPDIGNIGLALGDFDNDGFLDIYPSKGTTTNTDLPNLLFRNTLNQNGSRHFIKLKLIGTTSNKAAIGARIKVVTTSPARSQIREISARTGYGSANSLIAHFGLGTSTTISQIEIKWPSGIVQTLNNISTIDQILTITEDVVGPTFVFNPATNSTAAPIGTTLSVTLNENATLVAGKFITVRKGSATATPLKVFDVTAGTASSNTYTYTLAASTEYSTTYFISIDAGAFVDQYQNGSLAIVPTEWTFTTAEPPDLTFPVITFNPNDYISLPKGFPATQKLIALASDNKAVTSFTMHYRKVTATQFSQVFGTITSAPTYEFPILETFFDEMGMEFYLEAKDAAGNTTLEPATGYHRINLAFSDDNTTLSIASGASANNYQIRSVPFENMPSNQISVLFDELGQPDGTKYRILKYKNSPESWIEYPNGFNAVARGEGYFMLARNGANIKFGSATSPTNSQDNLFSLALVAGWNLIGNPYTVSASWNESIAGLTGVGALKIYQSGTYVDGNEMAIFSGGFVFADVAQTIPVKLKTSLTGGRTRTEEITSDLSKPKWLVPFELEQAGAKFLLGGIGMHPASKISYDDLDDLSPPAIDERLELAFEHPEHFMKAFSRDMVPTTDYFEWAFDVISDKKGLATLSWDPSTFGNNGKELMLYDLGLQRIMDMREVSNHTFDPVISNTFKLYYGEKLAEKIKPSGVVLGHPTPNPAYSVSSISFTLSDQQSQYDVKLGIYDMMGKRVNNLVEGSLKPGFYNYQWNVNDVTNGLYTYRLAVSAHGKQDVQTRKVIVNK